MNKTRTAPRFFDDRLAREWIGFTILRRIIITVGIVHFSLAAVSGYRAVVQIYDASIAADGNTLHAGSHVDAKVVTAGRTYIDVKVELIQSTNVSTLGTMRILSNKSFFYDFRPKRAKLPITISREMLSGFQSGRAVLRVTAEGHPQWLHTPPPKVAVLPIQLIS